MNYLGPRIVTKAVGSMYEVEWDKEEHTVKIYSKGKLKIEYQLNKLSESLDVYASLKKVKDCKRALEIKQLFPKLVLRKRYFTNAFVSD